MSEVPQAADTDAETNDNDSKIVNNVSMHFHGPVTTHNLHAGSGDINASEASPSRKICFLIIAVDTISAMMVICDIRGR